MQINQMAIIIKTNVIKKIFTNTIVKTILVGILILSCIYFGYRVFVVRSIINIEADCGGSPLWSPDSKRIVFTGNNGIYMADAKTGNVGLLLKGDVYGSSLGEFYSWHPNARYLLYAENGINDLAAKIWIIDTSDKSKKCIKSFKNSEVGSLIWSPNGKKIAYLEEPDGGNVSIWVMNADGNNNKQLVLTKDRWSCIEWAPDDKSIYYATAEDTDQSELFKIDINGQNKKQITKDGKFEAPFKLSRDGKKIAYMAGLGDSRVWVMNSDGGNIKLLTTGVYSFGELSPDWTEKATMIYPISYFMGVTNLSIGYISIIKEPTNILNDLTGTTWYDDISWSPDGKKLVFVKTFTRYFDTSRSSMWIAELSRY